MNLIDYFLNPYPKSISRPNPALTFQKPGFTCSPYFLRLFTLAGYFSFLGENGSEFGFSLPVFGLFSILSSSFFHFPRFKLFLFLLIFFLIFLINICILNLWKKFSDNYSFIFVLKSIFVDYPLHIRIYLRRI